MRVNSPLAFFSWDAFHPLLVYAFNSLDVF
jgi:hypothetical protein